MNIDWANALKCVTITFAIIITATIIILISLQIGLSIKKEIEWHNSDEYIKQKEQEEAEFLEQQQQVEEIQNNCQHEFVVVSRYVYGDLYVYSKCWKCNYEVE